MMEDPINTIANSEVVFFRLEVDVSRSILKGFPDDLIDELCEKTDKGLILKENHTFTSPSGAAMFGIGRNTNGWTKWKNKEGKTLDEVIRAF